MSAIQQLLTDHMDIWTAADTEKKSGRGRSSSNAASVYGIKKLRELILELAVRGKLVPQDSKDEPTSELLKRIQTEKTKLIAEGKIKKDKLLPPITDDEKPYELPKDWEWARLGFIGYTQTGSTPSKSKLENFGSDIPFIKPGDIYPNYIDYSNEGLSFVGAEQSGRIAQTDSLLMVCIGTIGKCNLIERNCSFNQQINSITPYLFDSRYLLSVCRSNYFHAEAWLRSSSTTIAILNKGNWEEICIPVPPYEEQHHIVAKVDELMALCDQMETQHNNAAEAHEKLVSHLLGTLTHIPVRVSVRPESVTSVRGEPVEPHPSTVRQAHSSGRTELTDSPQTEFEKNWQRIAAHFDTLFTTESSIDALKQTLLQLAVMGKLVPQNPNDEPASELLKRIQAEKTRLITEGKIKKDKPLSPITNDEKPFELPKGWEWVRFNDYATDIATGPFGSMIHQSDYVQDGVPLINPSHMIGDKIVADKSVSVSKTMANSLESYAIYEGDIVMARRGEVGRIALVTKNENGWLCGTGSFVLRFYREIYRDYLKVIFRCDYARAYLAGEAVGTTMVNLNHGILKKMPMGLPPLVEQHRIVAKVDELMTICNQLKSRITEANQLQQKLADVIVEQAVV